MQNKKIIIFVSMIIASAGLYFYFGNNELQKSVTHKSFAGKIAMFQPATHPALDEIVHACITTMNAGEKQYDFHIFNANGNTMLLQAQAAEMVQAGYDLIVTVGVGCSVAVTEIANKQQNKTPIVCTAIDDPEKFNLHGIYVTTVVDHTNYQEQIDLVLQLQPTIQKVLLVYDIAQGSGLEKDKNEILSILTAKGIALQTVEIFNVSELQQKVTPVLQGCDLVMVLKDNSVVSGIDSLISLCRRYHIPLLASDLNSGQKGAVLAYGFYEAESGIGAAAQAQLILEQGATPGAIPARQITNMKMVINPEQVQAQGLNIDYNHVTIPGVIVMERHA